MSSCLVSRFRTLHRRTDEFLEIVQRLWAGETVTFEGKHFRLKNASINAAAKASGINYRTAQRIVEAAAAYRQRQLAAVG